MFLCAMHPSTAKARTPVTWALQAAMAVVMAAVVMMAAAAIGSSLYLAKSWLGIDLMAGPSPLHGLLYRLVR